MSTAGTSHYRQQHSGMESPISRCWEENAVSEAFLLASPPSVPGLKYSLEAVGGDTSARYLAAAIHPDE